MARVKFKDYRLILPKNAFQCMIIFIFLKYVSTDATVNNTNYTLYESITEQNNKTIFTHQYENTINNISISPNENDEFKESITTEEDSESMNLSDVDLLNLEYTTNETFSGETTSQNNIEEIVLNTTDTTKIISNKTFELDDDKNTITTQGSSTENTLLNTNVKLDENTLKPSTNHGYRTSKVYDGKTDDDTIFQFWTTLSGNSHNENDVNGNKFKKQTFKPSNTITTSTPWDTKEDIIPESKTETHNMDIPWSIDEFAMKIDNDEDEIDEEYFNITKNKDELSDNQTLIENSFMEAADYGMMKMNELYGVQEPKLYQMGLILEKDNPARYVAAFNWQTEEAKNISKFGYASLQAFMYLHDKFPDELESRTSDEEEKENVTKENLPRPPRPSPPRSSLLRQQCPLRSDPRCPSASKRYRTHDGTCNNLRRLRWGSALSAVQRFLPPEYGDGVQSVRRAFSGSPLPSARSISEAVHTPKESEEGIESPVTHMLMQWGQFLDHDITSSSQARGFNGSVPRCCDNGGREFFPPDLLHPECLPIFVPENDKFYASRGIRCLDFIRSSPAPRSGCEFGYREQLNQVTAFIDGSPVYSSSAKQSDKLRLFRNGLLQYGRVQARRPVLPPDIDDEEELCRGGAVDASCFKAGDGRVNEHPGLVAMHIVWLRKHNRLATELSHINPHWSDEKVYQETRKIIGAFIQHITYREFLPIVLGSEVMKLFDLQLKEKGYFKGYTTKVNPNPANSFGAAAFRFGHSLVQDTFMRYDQFHRPVRNSVSLHNELTNPSNIWSFGAVDRLLLGLMNQPSQQRDEFISPELTNHLFQTPRFSFGMDLASINIQRGRDHGLPPYVQWREPCGLSSVLEWEDLLKIMPIRAVRNLESVYRNVEDIDLFTGGMAERPVIKGLVGPTFACIIAQQFSNLRKGDRFWYENGGFESSFTPAQLQQIRKTTLAQILCQTMENVETLQPFAFLIPDGFRNRRISCTSAGLNNFDLTPWTEGNINNIDNDLSGSEQIIKTKHTTINSLPQHEINGLLSDSFTNKKTTNLNKKTTTEKSIHIDDKLDVITHDKPGNSFSNVEIHINNPLVQTTDSTFTRRTVQTKLTTRPVHILNDKLDFFGKRIKTNETPKNNPMKRSLPENKQNNKDNLFSSLHVTSTTTERDAQQKTFPFYEQLPFYNFLTGLSSQAPKKTTRRPQVTAYQQQHTTTTTTTKRPQKYTYLVNIVPKTTTPEYENTEIVKITVQSDLPRPSYNKRPVYNNNKLEYRPVNLNDNSQDYRPSYNNPYNTLDKFDMTDNYKPVPTYLGSNFPINENRPLTDQNSYSFSTFTNFDSSTKPYRPTNDHYSYNYQQDSTFNRPSKPSSSNNYDYNLKPNNYNDYHTAKPSNTGITIYIDNNVQFRPDLQDDTNYSSQSSEEDVNIPLFTRPNYNKPLSQTPLSDYYNSKPTFNNNHYTHSSSGNDNFASWTQKPDPSYNTPDNDFDPYTPVYKEKTQRITRKPIPTTRKPVRPFMPTPRPSHVNVHLASEHGNYQPSDISIVINPLLEYKSSSKSQAKPHTTRRPSKYYYIKNVLYQYPHSPDDLMILSKTSNSTLDVTNTKRRDIIKENYNNAWYPNHHKKFSKTEERKNNKSTSNSLEILKSNSNLSPSIFNIESKESDDEFIDLSISERKDTQLVNGKQNTLDRVFFDIIPSENSPVRWLYYKEKPENSSVKFIMPEMVPDPLASKELPRPIISSKFTHSLNHLKKNKKIIENVT